MVLEAVMVVVDNSESSRNGDYQPSRFDAQADAVNIIFQSIVQGNPESSVGLMSMGGKGPEVLVTLTTEPGKILEGLHRTRKQIKGKSNLSVGLQVASLALKHRQNHSQRQRIVAFICSPIEEEEKKLVTLAKKLKKMNTSVDFVHFGDLEDEDTKKKLESFNKTVKAGETSHLVTVQPSSKLLSDQLIATPIIAGENAGSGGSGSGADGGMGGGGGGGAGGGSGGGIDSELGFDPNMDPELALAIRMSLEDARLQQQREEAAREREEQSKKSELEAVPEGDEGAGSSDKVQKKDEDKKDGDKGGESGAGEKMDTT